MFNRILKPTFIVVGTLNVLEGILVTFNLANPTKFSVIANYFSLGLIMLSFGLFGTFENNKK